jgi:hypothetical protein
MTVVFNKQIEQRFTANDVLWAKEQLVNAIVEQALLGQTEAFVDMIMDGMGPKDITRETVNETLRGVKESAQDFIADMVGDLERTVLKRLEAVNYGAAVTGIKYDLAGDVTDIEVNVSFGTE